MEGSELHFIEELKATASDRLKSGDDLESVERLLFSKGASEEQTYEILRPFRKEHYDASRKAGTKILGIGGCFILSGFVITCFNYHSNQSFAFAMYGLTSIGLGLVFWALYKIFG